MADNNADMEQWWPQLPASTQRWLVNHNGEPVPLEIQEQIIGAGGTVAGEDWWVGTSDDDGFYFSDSGIDWIEAAANDEFPGAP